MRACLFFWFILELVSTCIPDNVLKSSKHSIFNNFSNCTLKSIENNKKSEIDKTQNGDTGQIKINKSVNFNSTTPDTKHKCSGENIVLKNNTAIQGHLLRHNGTANFSNAISFRNSRRKYSIAIKKRNYDDMDSGCFSKLRCKICYKAQCTEDGLKLIIRKDLKHIKKFTLERGKENMDNNCTIMPEVCRKVQGCFSWSHIKWTKTRFKGCLHANIKHHSSDNEDVGINCIRLNCADYEWGKKKEKTEEETPKLSPSQLQQPTYPINQPQYTFPQIPIQQYTPVIGSPQPQSPHQQQQNTKLQPHQVGLYQKPNQQYSSVKSPQQLNPLHTLYWPPISQNHQQVYPNQLLSQQNSPLKTSPQQLNLSQRPYQQQPIPKNSQQVYPNQISSQQNSPAKTIPQQLNFSRRPYQQLPISQNRQQVYPNQIPSQQNSPLKTSPQQLNHSQRPHQQQPISQNRQQMYPNQIPSQQFIPVKASPQLLNTAQRPHQQQLVSQQSQQVYPNQRHYQQYSPVKRSPQQVYLSQNPNRQQPIPQQRQQVYTNQIPSQKYSPFKGSVLQLNLSQRPNQQQPVSQ